MEKEVILELEKINKIFPGVKALRRVSFSIKSNEIIGLVGENGAGKSTLMKILIGLYQPDEGQIMYYGKKINFRGGPKDAAKKGIGMVFQEQSLLPNLTVAENIFLGQEGKFVKKGWLLIKKMELEAKNQLKNLGRELDINPRSYIRDLTYLDRQMIEIARLLWLNFICNIKNPILILDEPTTVLNQDEIKNLFEILRNLKKRSTVIFISHRLEEVMEISDRIIIMKDGENISEIGKKDFDIKKIYKLMVGKDISNEYYKESMQAKSNNNIVLEVKDIEKKGCYKPLSFNINKGEIVSLVGLFGSGKEDLARSIAGIVKPDKGTILINEKKIKLGAPISAIRSGIGYLPADRREEGIALQLDVTANITAAIISKLSNSGFVNSSKERKISTYWRERLNIKTPSLRTLCVFLSGGNQQKVVLSKWLAAEVKVLVMDHPTRGIDVGAKEEVYEIIRNLANQGISIILMSDTLEEDIALSNRILIMRDKGIVKEIDCPIGGKPMPIDLIEFMG